MEEDYTISFSCIFICVLMLLHFDECCFLQFYKWFTDLESAMKSEVSDSHVVPRCKKLGNIS